MYNQLFNRVHMVLIVIYNFYLFLSYRVQMGFLYIRVQMTISLNPS